MYTEVFHLDEVAEDGKMKPYDDVANLVREFADYLREELPEGLPHERDIEHCVQLKQGAVPSSRPLFRHAHVGKEALQVFVDKLLRKKWIERSSSPWVSNNYAVPKRDPVTGELPTKIQWVRGGDPSKPVRWVIDYRYVNSATNIPRIPIPRINEDFDRLAGAHVFTLIDLASGYHQMKWLLTRANDICVFSKNRSDHLQHLRRVFEVLRSEQLYSRPSKWHFFAQPQIRFLGHIVSGEGVRVNPDKTAAIANWACPQSVKDLQSFLGFAGYYRHFVRSYAHLVLPLSELLKSTTEWKWGSEQEFAFNTIEKTLISAPILRLPDMNLPFQVTTDASKTCVGGVLSQQVDGFDHPVSFYSRKLSDTESKWAAHELELYAIKHCLGRWRSYLLGDRFVVHTDNSACRWFLYHPNVSPKMARWLAFFGQFNFELVHKMGTSNVVADALSRPPVCVTTVGSFVFKTRFVTRAAKILIEGAAAFLPSPMEVASIGHASLLVVVEDDLFVRDVNAAYVKDKDCVAILRGLQRREERVCEKYDLLDGILVVKSEDAVRVLRIPHVDSILLRLMHDFHDAADVAHPCVERTMVAMRQYFWWPGMREHIAQYISTCEACVRHKSGS
ncbi:unnamed protein product [Phytophthora fragariaefolia]|uniref:Unnamed protein product n=1 Tax=Phytophthora fragariaefolia TaxID=1490495 RepID=A0A9W6YEP6_9STRA|nr:unnamed protein product [Phytophthora fragariaefolia]